jgi:lycopene beta-cyclase
MEFAMTARMTPSDSVAIIGAGCAGLVLAHALDRGQHVDIFDPHPLPRPDHIWSYWDFGEPYFQLPRTISKGNWQHWDIITHKGASRLTGQKARYRAISSAVYEKHLLAKINQHSNTHVIAQKVGKCSSEKGMLALETDQATTTRYQRVFDTARYRVSPNGLVQHFLGQWVSTSANCFDKSVVTLMDFRVSQTAGIHFIYLLPLTPRKALIESTVFSAAPLASDWYRGQIATYLKQFYPGRVFKIETEESGAIPMAELLPSTRDPATPVGLVGGALRASSGYAFAQIHRQIETMRQIGFRHAEAGASNFERWMDRIFLRVLIRAPERASELFLRIAQQLSGDEFGQFMNGRAPWRVILKVIRAMPKSLFLRALI